MNNRSIVAVIISVLGLAAAAASAQTVTVLLDNMAGPYEAGPIGPLDDDWTFFGFGPPSYNYVENGLHHDDDGCQGWKFPANLTSWPQESAMVAYYQADYDLHAKLEELGAYPPDETQPVVFSAWFYGFHGLVDPEDPIYSPDIECFIRADFIDSTESTYLMPPLGGESWNEATSTIENGLGPDDRFALVVGFSFNTSWYDPQYETTVLVDHITVTYTPAIPPELRILSIDRVGPESVQLRWEASPGRSYRVLHQPHVAPGYRPDGAFDLLDTVLGAENYTDSAASGPGAYYRIEIVE